MRILITIILALMMTSPVLALDKCMSGSWADPDIKGEGISLEVHEDTAVAYFFTYTFFDRMAQNWVLFVGPPDHMKAYDTVPFAFDPIEYEIGTGSLFQIDHNTLQFTHDFSYDLDQVEDPLSITVTPWCLDERCEHVFRYKRLTQPIPCE